MEPQIIEVSLADLNDLLAVLSQAQQEHYCRDLVEGYRKLSSRLQKSALTTALDDQITKIGAYVQEAKETEDES